MGTHIRDQFLQKQTEISIQGQVVCLEGDPGKQERRGTEMGNKRKATQWTMALDPCWAEPPQPPTMTLDPATRGQDRWGFQAAALCRRWGS